MCACACVCERLWVHVWVHVCTFLFFSFCIDHSMFFFGVIYLFSWVIPIPMCVCWLCAPGSQAINIVQWSVSAITELITSQMKLHQACIQHVLSSIETFTELNAATSNRRACALWDWLSRGTGEFTSVAAGKQNGATSAVWRLCLLHTHCSLATERETHKHCCWWRECFGVLFKAMFHFHMQSFNPGG